MNRPVKPQSRSFRAELGNGKFPEIRSVEETPSQGKEFFKILILGGGISGLSAAWFLTRKYPNAKITLLEKGARLGGVLPHGPRTFPYREDSRLLELARELNLEIVRSSSSAKKRFLWQGGALRSMGSMMPWGVCLRALMRRRFEGEDCTIYDFAKRRFNQEVAETVFDPMALGIYAGDIRKLSLKSCFPKIHEWDVGKGSLLKGLLRGSKGLFTVKGGMGKLVEEMEKKLPIEVVLRCPVEEMGVGEVKAGGKIWKADLIVSALPMRELNRLTGAFEGVEIVSLNVVELIYPRLNREGFGYLVPTREREPILGAIWDSSIFPEEQGRVSVFLRAGVDEDPERIAEEALQRHLGLSLPLQKRVWKFPDAIPQFGLGFTERKRMEEEGLLKEYPGLVLLGNYWDGASVDACIQRAKDKCKAALHLRRDAAAVVL